MTTTVVTSNEGARVLVYRRTNDGLGGPMWCWEGQILNLSDRRWDSVDGDEAWSKYEATRAARLWLRKMFS